MLTKTISGGQTGADQAALDIAVEFGILHLPVYTFVVFINVNYILALT